MTEQLSKLYYNMGLELLRDNKAEAALDILKKAVSIKDTNIETWNLLGLCYLKLCRFEMACYCWRESLNADSANNRAEEFIKQFQPVYEEAREVFSRINLLVSEKRYKEADREFQKSIFQKNFSDCLEVRNLYGILKILSGDRKKALDIWKSSLEIKYAAKNNAVRYLANEIEKKGLFGKMFNKLLKG